MSGVHGYNPVGLIGAPFGVFGPTGAPAIGPGVVSSSAQPSAGVPYVATGAPVLITASAEPGDAVLITIFSPAASTGGGPLTPVATMSSLLLTRLPLGYAVQFDGFARPLLLNCSGE